MLIYNKQYHNETSSAQLSMDRFGLVCVCVVLGANKLG